MKRIYSISLAITLAFLSTTTFGEPATRFARDRKVDALHIKLDLNVDLEKKFVDALASIDVLAMREVSTVTLDAIDLGVSKVTVTRPDHGTYTVDFTNDGKHILVPLGPPLRPGERATIRVKYTVDNPQSGLHFFGPSKDEPDVPYVVWSQGESVTNSYWFPCFDHPNERQTTELVVTTDKKFKVSANGHLVARKEDPAHGTVTYRWLQDKAHAAYLVSMIVGDFVTKEDTWRGKPLNYWVHPKFKDQIDRSFKNTKRMLDFFSDRIGIEYPWDRYGQVCCEGFGGGMENTSVTTMGNRALHDKRSSLDADSDGLIAHELAHQWWGDMLTCRDWSHLWLNEGFASYFQALWTEESLGDDEFRYDMYRKANRAKRGGKKRPIVDRSYASPGSMFDARAYPKGAWVLHMMRKRLGDEAFWNVINRYGTDNRLKTVETADLRKAVDTITGRTFERFFYDWTERPGHPEVTVKFKWNAEDNLADISIKQTQEDVAFHFPLTVVFEFDDETAPITIVRDVTKKKLGVYYPLPKKPHLIRIDPAHSVLLELKEKKGRDFWRAQLTDDPDPIARIRAATHFGKSDSDSDRKFLAEALVTEKFWGVQREIARALGETGGDIARDALIAGLTIENHRARRGCAEELDSFFQDDKAIEAIRPIVQNGDPSYNVEAAAIRTYGKLGADDAVGVLTPVLSRDSRSEVIRRAALTGFGSARDTEAAKILIEWTRPGKPRLARPAAIRALANLTNETYIDDATMRLIVDTISQCLDDTGKRVRRTAVSALGSLSDPSKAKQALPALRSLLANNSDERSKPRIKRTIKAIESGEPAQVQLAELRSDLEDAQDKNDELSERISKLEAMLTKDTKDTDQADGE
jgi:aminopeptidase N